ncbi:MAG: hypothetical protein WCJ58_02680 [bacterium]
MNNNEKALKIKAILAEQGVDYSIGFGDSPGDIPMLEIVDQAFVVKNNNHHPELLKYAVEKHWNIFANEAEIIAMLGNLQL